MRRALLCTAGVMALSVPAAPAGADQSLSVTLSNSRPGKGTTVTIDVSPSSDQGSGGESPRSVLVRAARGFMLDRRAVAKLCTPQQAQGNACPSESRIGGGTANVTVSSAVVPPTHLTAQIDLYLGPPSNPGDLAAIVAHFKEPKSDTQGSSTGRVFKESAGPFGLDTRFDTAQSFKPPQGFTVHLDRLHVSLGAHRTVRVKVKQKKTRHGKKKHGPKYKHVTVNLITTPRTCSGSWPYEVRVGYPDGHETVTGGSVACSRAT